MVSPSSEDAMHIRHTLALTSEEPWSTAQAAVVARSGSAASRVALMCSPADGTRQPAKWERTTQCGWKYDFRI